MGILRFIWRGVLAFDRIGSRIPQIVQMWLIELFFMMPVTFFISSIIDAHGACGVPGTGEHLDGGDWTALAVGLLAGFFFVKSLVKPRVKTDTWTPTVHADIGDSTVYGGNRSWAVEYTYLTSHPSYILLGLLTAPIPVVMLWANENHGGNSFYFRVAGTVGLCVLAFIALARLLSWYVFRLGRRELAVQAGDLEMSERRLGWEVAWKPVLMLLIMIYAIGGIPIGYMWWDELRKIDRLPVLTAADAVDHDGQYFRIRGTLSGKPVWWPHGGGGRGGDNYSGAGVLVNLETGGEAVLLAESLSVPDLIGVLKKVHDGHIDAHGRVVDEITANQRRYYGFRLKDFPDASPDGRVLVLLEYP
ncbi:hypothetical protein PT015_11295 [Candidatus Mycobacterium wuenschmannii]|uniref:Transmembrane protein n=1 Tax=Candidatus Mycobacterium wuenschmannii TaxID=3027808 RepID=A0ABY8W435_9MYCO|nr:hypothetical protein [Candidatus Mycobacterium wuenschmannii]WIM89950.1 hypothetical protein PT015_11295 [Candidatus Mycobacterium wuenschmannii]